ncbi:hypothetical protein D3C77_446250 [compost metagenome]
MRLSRHKVIVGVRLSYVHIIHIACNRGKHRLPLRQRPAVSIVRVEWNGVAFLLNRFQRCQEFFRRSRCCRHTSVFKHLLVIQNTGKVNRSRNSVSYSINGSLFQADVFLAHLLQIAKRFKKLRCIHEWNARWQQEDISIIIGTHSNRNLAFIIRKGLELYFHIWVFLVKISGVLFKYRIHNICSLRDHGNLAFYSPAVC